MAEEQVKEAKKAKEAKNRPRKRKKHRELKRQGSGTVRLRSLVTI
ncbi:MAG: hypothetical protein ACYS4T_18715 [Planctomycetota bacterium]